MNEYENMTKEELLTRCLFLEEVVEERNEQIEKMETEIKTSLASHLIFSKNYLLKFTSKCVWEALNPNTKMCVPNTMYIKIEELLQDYINGGSVNE